MTAAWPRVKIGKILSKSDEWITPDPDTSYREVTVKLWGKGVICRREVLGAEIVSTRRKRIRAGQLILSRIDARSGALGIVPESLDGALVSNDFPTFTINPELALVPFIGWFIKTESFGELCRQASEGTTNRVRLKDDRFLAFELRLPSIPEQRRIVARIDSVARKIDEIDQLKESIEREARALIASVLHDSIKGAHKSPMGVIAPIVRRPVEVEASADYQELGVRSFGKGTFHKPSLKGISVGNKRLFRIEPGDLIFSNVFAWEGGVAIARPEDSGRVGSHRFIACVPKKGIAVAEFLQAYFQTREGLEILGAASPGGAGRNRTLGIEALQGISVPLPKIERQEWFSRLHAKVEKILSMQRESREELKYLLVSLLNKSLSEGH